MNRKTIIVAIAGLITAFASASFAQSAQSTTLKEDCMKDVAVQDVNVRQTFPNIMNEFGVANMQVSRNHYPMFVSKCSISTITGSDGTVSHILEATLIIKKASLTITQTTNGVTKTIATAKGVNTAQAAPIFAQLNQIDQPIMTQLKPIVAKISAVNTKIKSINDSTATSDNAELTKLEGQLADLQSQVATLLGTMAKVDISYQPVSTASVSIDDSQAKDQASVTSAIESAVESALKNPSINSDVSGDLQLQSQNANRI